MTNSRRRSSSWSVKRFSILQAYLRWNLIGVDETVRSIKRLEQSIFNESYFAAAHPCARAFRHNFQISNFTSAFIFTLVQNMEGLNKRYRCWMCQQDLSRSVYYRHMRRNGCSALVRMPTKECHTTKNTNISQERNNFSVDMEEESSDMDKFKYVWW